MAAVEERKERPNLILLAFVGIAVLLSVQVQTVTRQAATEK